MQSSEMELLFENFIHQATPHFQSNPSKHKLLCKHLDSRLAHMPYQTM